MQPNGKRTYNSTDAEGFKKSHALPTVPVEANCKVVERFWPGRTCFECPLPDCVLGSGVRGPDLIRMAQQFRAHQLRRDGWTAASIARKLRCSERTVHRYLQ